MLFCNFLFSCTKYKINVFTEINIIVEYSELFNGHRKQVDYNMINRVSTKYLTYI